MGLLRAVFRNDGPVIVVECRNCGTSLDRSARRCPVCESDEIVKYAIR